ncbi:MAG: S23 ribosomal protein [Candidatus Roizmanbacteria bacterium GW2011_GWA2_35_8]|uniref:S23 ribosomal protein n=1 Tax=Candidatus Roizmanbacteria bacterium GW2011_GWA2_35_8 TaxID=1618479 RepID=A0A0G0FHD0_9BACT|nr:MAG: S23 ribosomal protein [Candidatus Roizmanbacteria bacterium GW2011_GWA2_35_8]
MKLRGLVVVAYSPLTFSPSSHKVYQVYQEMKFTRFEDIIAWKKSEELAILVYKLFKDCRDYGFKDQIQRACISVSNNIAEGYERMSNREFRNFLSIAKGSAGEVRSMLSIAHKLGYIDLNSFQNLNFLAIEISKILSGLIKTL